MVFGSQARRSAQPDSDLDVGVLFRTTTRDLIDRLGPVRETLAVGDRLDLVPLNGAPALLLREVALDGKPVFERFPGAWERFRVVAFKRYMDSGKFRRLQAEHLRTLYG